MSVLKNLSMTSGVFFVVFILSAISAQNDDLKLPPEVESDLESMEEIQELFQAMQLLFETKVASNIGQGTVPDEEDVENDFAVDEKDAENGVPVDEEDLEIDAAMDEEDVEDDDAVDPNGCRCHRYGCCCCKQIRRGPRKFRRKWCLSVSYLPHHFGILIKLTVGRRTLFSKEISAKNPPPICINVPKMRIAASVCIQFNNLSMSRRHVSGCSKFLIRIFTIPIFSVKLGCFRFNFLDATQQVGEAQFPYFDEPQAKIEGPEPLYLGEVQMENIKLGANKKK